MTAIGHFDGQKASVFPLPFAMDVGKWFLCHMRRLLVRRSRNIRSLRCNDSFILHIFAALHYIIRPNGTIIPRGFRMLSIRPPARALPPAVVTFSIAFLPFSPFSRGSAVWSMCHRYLSCFTALLVQVLLGCVAKQYNWFRWLNCFMNWKANGTRNPHVKHAISSACADETEWERGRRPQNGRGEKARETNERRRQRF